MSSSESESLMESVSSAVSSGRLAATAAESLTPRGTAESQADDIQAIEAHMVSEDDCAIQESVALEFACLDDSYDSLVGDVSDAQPPSPVVIAEIDLTATDDEDIPICGTPVDASSLAAAAADTAARPKKRKKRRPPSPHDPDCYELIDCTDDTKEYSPPTVIKRKVSSKVANATSTPAAAAAETAPPPPPPTVTIVKTIEVEKAFNCHICLDKMEDPVSTMCGHVFCKACITQAIAVQKSCPDCRKKLTKASKLIRLYI